MIVVQGYSLVKVLESMMLQPSNHLQWNSVNTASNGPGKFGRINRLTVLTG